MPALPRLLAAGVTTAALLVPSAAHAATCGTADQAVAASGVPAARAATLCLLNVERRAHRLGKLRSNRRLEGPATQHSASMVNARYFEHGNFLGRLAAYTSGAQWWTVGENIAWGGGSLGTPRAIVREWMDSPGHRANILSRSYRQIGIGIVTGTPAGMAGATYTTDFGARK